MQLIVPNFLAKLFLPLSVPFPGMGCGVSSRGTPENVASITDNRGLVVPESMKDFEDNEILKGIITDEELKRHVDMITDIVWKRYDKGK